MKWVPYWWLTNIRHQRKEFSHSGEAAPGICTPLRRDTSINKSLFQVTDGHWQCRSSGPGRTFTVGIGFELRADILWFNRSLTSGHRTCKKLFRKLPPSSGYKSKQQRSGHKLVKFGKVNFELFIVRIQIMYVVFVWQLKVLLCTVDCFHHRSHRTPQWQVLIKVRSACVCLWT